MLQTLIRRQTAREAAINLSKTTLVHEATLTPSIMEAHNQNPAHLLPKPSPATPFDEHIYGVTLEVATHFDDLTLSTQEWDATVLAYTGSIYMTLDWLRTWWTFYGGNRELRLLVGRADGKVVALLPIYIDTLGIWPLRIRVARLLGSNCPPKVFDPPIDSPYSKAFLNSALSHLLQHCRVDLVSLGPISSDHPLNRDLAMIQDTLQSRITLWKSHEGVHTAFSLPNTITEYLTSLSKNEQKQRRKYDLRSLRNSHEVSVDTLGNPPGDILATFDHFATLHADQWSVEGKSGHFGSWPKALEFNRSLVNTMARLGRVRFVHIKADDQVIMQQYVFAFGTRWWWELPARLVGPSWDKYSLGPTGVVTMLGQAINEGISRVEGGLGHYDYKLRLNATELPNITIRFSPSRWSSIIKYRAFNLFRTVMEIFYIKLWYHRLQPKLPKPFKLPHAPFWIRFDF